MGSWRFLIYFYYITHTQPDKLLIIAHLLCCVCVWGGDNSYPTAFLSKAGSVTQRTGLSFLLSVLPSPPPHPSPRPQPTPITHQLLLPPTPLRFPSPTSPTPPTPTPLPPIFNIVYMDY